MEQPDLLKPDLSLLEAALDNILVRRGFVPQGAPVAEIQPDLTALIQQEIQRAQQQRLQPAKIQKPLGLKWQAASIFPLKRELYKPAHIHRTRYSIPGVPKGMPPQLLEITDEEERQYQGRGRNGAGIIPAIDIAEDFVFCNTNFIMGRRNNGCPGVWIVGTLEDGKLSLKQETDIMRQRQNAFFQDWVDDARKHAAAHTFDAITDMHRIAAEYLDIFSESWQTQEYKNLKEPCRYCKEMISNEAVKCPKCGGITNPERYARMKREEDELIAAIAGPLKKTAKVQSQETVNA